MIHSRIAILHLTFVSYDIMVGRRKKCTQNGRHWWFLRGEEVEVVYKQHYFGIKSGVIDGRIRTVGVWRFLVRMVFVASEINVVFTLLKCA